MRMRVSFTTGHRSAAALGAVRASLSARHMMRTSAGGCMPYAGKGDGRVRAHCRIAERVGESGAHLGPVHNSQALGGTAVALGSNMELSEALCGAPRHSGRASPSSTRHGGRKPIDAYRRLHMQQMLTHRHAHTRADAHTCVHTQTCTRTRACAHADTGAHTGTHMHPRTHALTRTPAG